METGTEQDGRGTDAQTRDRQTDTNTHTNIHEDVQKGREGTCAKWKEPGRNKKKSHEKQGNKLKKDHEKNEK